MLEKCKAGLHDLTGDNLILYKEKGRISLHRACRACKTNRSRGRWVSRSEEDRGKTNQAAKDYRAKNPFYVSWNRYKLTKELFLAILIRQDGACAICKRAFTDELRPNVDHDHTCCPGARSCGKCIRGLLCRTCNIGISYFDGKPEWLHAALKYIGGLDELDEA